MSIINIERILSADNVGKNLEDEAVFYHLERLLQGKKEVLDSDAKTILIQAEPPNWVEAFDLSVKLLEESKDLRIVTGLIRCLIALHGLIGCELGLKLLCDILEKYWDNIYPVPEDEDDYIVRINALGPLNDWTETLSFLTQAVILNHKSNKITLRVFGLTANKLQAKANEQTFTSTQLKYVMAEIPTDAKEAILKTVENAISYVVLIKKRYEDSVGIVPDLSALLDCLNWIKPYLQLNDNPAETHSVPVDSNQSHTQETSKVIYQEPKRLATREDAIAILEEVCVFLEQSEPAHPAPLFIRRGQKLLKMNFLEIVKELSPDSYEEVCKLGGVYSSE